MLHISLYNYNVILELNIYLQQVYQTFLILQKLYLKVFI